MNRAETILVKLALSQARMASKTLRKLHLPLTVGAPRYSDMLAYSRFYLNQSISYMEEALANNPNGTSMSPES